MSDSDIQVKLSDAAALVSADHPARIVFEQGSEVTVELYAPVGEDRQTPHDRDELYIVATGEGTFRRGEEVVSFTPGDMLYVPAHVPHRFETFSQDFKAWVIFYGPKRLAPTGAT
ncbi:cupin domain-containing protein [Fodinicurvata fenggangensis]|uniref:cupin domain-containing protein n=1 Tax=Fodinicurvata fenggangensis TaxID=1121830 RepID=UPI000550BD50|nr:cupin domain-containing protein [Fodinicurvata fenggangensis]